MKKQILFAIFCLTITSFSAGSTKDPYDYPKGTLDYLMIKESKYKDCKRIHLLNIAAVLLGVGSPGTRDIQLCHYMLEGLNQAEKNLFFSNKSERIKQYFYNRFPGLEECVNEHYPEEIGIACSTCEFEEFVKKVGQDYFNISKSAEYYSKPYYIVIKKGCLKGCKKSS